MVNLDFQGTSFSVPLYRNNKKVCHFPVRRETFQFCMALFRVGPSPLNYCIRSKKTTLLIRRIQICIRNIPRQSPDNWREAIEERSVVKYTVIFILQKLGFVTSKEKHCTETSRVMDFLGFKINSEAKTSFLWEQNKKR